MHSSSLSGPKEAYNCVSDFPQNQLVGPCSEVLKIHTIGSYDSTENMCGEVMGGGHCNA